MTTSEQLLILGLSAVGAFLVVKYAYKRNVHKPAQVPPVTTGVIGYSPMRDPAAPKTVGDFARYDRSLPVNADSSPQLTTGDFTRLDHGYVPDNTPDVTSVYNDPYTYNHPL